MPLCMNEVSLFFSASKLTPLQSYHATVPCCFADFGRCLPWEVGNIAIHVFCPCISLAIAQFALHIVC